MVQLFEYICICLFVAYEYIGMNAHVFATGREFETKRNIAIIH